MRPPPSSLGVTNELMPWTNVTRQPIMMPGALSGSVTRRKLRQGGAPSVRAASGAVEREPREPDAGQHEGHDHERRGRRQQRGRNEAASHGEAKTSVSAARHAAVTSSPTEGPSPEADSVGLSTRSVTPSAAI